MKLDQFVKDRDKALLSLDKQKIEAYMNKYHITGVPKKEIVFWASVHKFRNTKTERMVGKMVG